ncbi:MBL fold metallo-hydrolase [Flaviaesturariibacter amylovorans]|uniref:MBL fold metallo-hydrolase n=1 Tax=Flaviaesturariibacter amylovorans TaxID=1084520 RepID=A0ABP8GZ69_9BACT
MALQFTSLNSGSNGNCYYVGNDTDAVLVDAGISCREIERRMERLGLSLEKVRAVLVSHEHSDHIRGLPTLTRKHGIPIYVTARTYKGGRMYLERSKVHDFSGQLTFNIGSLSIQAFSKVHDAADPYSFTISYGGVTVGVFTDLGVPCANLVHHFRQCHAAFLESNYDEEMLEHGKYPWILKQRIRGGQGHLSNRQALDLFRAHRPPFMTHLLLAHLSQNNNDVRLVQALFDAHADGVQTLVAPRYSESPLFQVSTAGAGPTVRAHYEADTPGQLKLSFE